MVTVRATRADKEMNEARCQVRWDIRALHTSGVFAALREMYSTKFGGYI